MAILCESCSKPVRTRSCVSRCPVGASVSRRMLRTPKPFRSTKGASKARRDQINAELQTLRSLLPISQQEKERLSYLHTMALVCFHLRETQLFHPGKDPPPPARPALTLLDPELLLSLPGFIVALTANGKLAYISENVSHFLGFSVVELLAHGDSIFDLLNSSASRIMQEKLCFAQQHPGTEIEFTAEMHTSRAFRGRYGQNRPMSLRGRFLTPDVELTASSPALTFVAFCTPVASVLKEADCSSQSTSFQSWHTLDMKVTEMTENVIYHLGYQREELIGLSWYSLLHPEDTERAAEMHRTLMNDATRHNWHVVVRLLCKDLSWAWVQVTALRENEERQELITCSNHILREEEGLYIQSQDRQHGTVSPATLDLRYYSRETMQQTKPDKVSLFYQEQALVKDKALKYNPCQLLDLSEEKMLPTSLQPLLPTSLPVPSMGANATTVQGTQETRCPIPAGWNKCSSCPDKAGSLSPLNTCALSSPENAYSPDSSPSMNFSPLCEERPPMGMFSTMGSSPDPDRWAINILAEQIHSLAEIFSQYAKQKPQEPPSIPLSAGQSTEDINMVPRQGWGPNGTLDFPEELSVDEEIIANILSNILDHDSLNQSTSELGSVGNAHVPNAEPQISLLQAPLSEATPCLEQCFFMHPLSSSVSSDSHVPSSQWDCNFYTAPQQGSALASSLL
ncbi:neuronal PAS domain-containing protein 4-like [Varanus komodoensis]|uniref:neuronal PAS domain-containing protein 4-like n=1 Tax=Varanus komodoensis TaxID=61221 RepID=UPI001CF77772|nr:neuronal PAS domain-containing protein 4-like [Varanus komodoensis]